jgi:hypothetical protein
MKDLLKLIGCWAAFGVSIVGSGILISVLHLHLNHPPNIDSGPIHILTVFLAGGLLVLGLCQRRGDWQVCQVRALRCWRISCF